MNDDFAWLDATAQAELVRTGERHAASSWSTRRSRGSSKLNPQLNAVIHPLFDKAATTAAGAELPDGPFRGVPFLVKDAVCHTAGRPVPLRHARAEGRRLDRAPTTPGSSSASAPPAS